VNTVEFITVLDHDIFVTQVVVRLFIVALLVTFKFSRFVSQFSVDHSLTARFVMFVVCSVLSQLTIRSDLSVVLQFIIRLAAVSRVCEIIHFRLLASVISQRIEDIQVSPPFSTFIQAH